MKSLSLMIFLGLISTACSTFRKNEYVAIPADRTIAQEHQQQ
ncbi:hypothetical protein [Peredibacter starrii]|uniref:Lipoprotein n=1 Tax=Peredibacter starrii TaxID=28202 RepID=A0AAX4HM52_9BACT|nr:hypothetical protein [Peredibacter starrii]WPU64301.1 hypothetical protein SOO65_16525 [Peredibacter starrii]